ncbi:L-aminoadipate-semialdehyde dehydrogenase large subunit [Histoplasma capsulatum G186AR]|uniref:Alpha-aminoadipate reductase n=2 Tax=Ajellomyces capsulatus TaxID=5037 RepID=C0NYE7_AJECG|nr:L-aminoadipate-semialdehyde dehydrogenase large subunit [Histoplasma capsulatum G186AR]EEH03815.1 L-aminoadipate-semialdehyde dehydrogenase large subunit [Histoplasma capsulatum G186AR]KAG5293610.1 L-aminoadipate-semialdehyde dehydrogenase large subunit [Histoplasma capsulatum]QSS75062.1 L-aminoadipate-semialdehyde dehydrogenase large subunit [Histoplasma capsulatum G186AR]
MEELPDPTTDLDWSGYVGSIQSHFAENARKYPDRICVVETKSSEAPERRFTYRQIYEASNTLAHYLHDAGVTNGDVVMVWAHRSVDLVVSIMGTLMSAATMSILDPAYPPARQKIYLEVSQPCALVNIARATDEAGPLAPTVRKYIDEELKLKAEVPSLRIHSNGFLSGGEIEGQDIFGHVRSKASSSPDSLVGPDSNPTLSFTSGSEGRPKGVLGRHFSLAKYFGWMAQRFELTSESRFTLLSGIAHDPVQRDIFTPLFLGAQLLVPSKEDIQHEKLAEWMAEHKPTVTHLTPAMGQILVGGASAKFPSLDRAFFVGDVLTTRDCRSLRDLAVNVNIVNMYGTTETQRAVSYYEIPNRVKDPNYLDKLKDTVPAGKGMKDVQLLVVNRDDRAKLCKIGEVGEIYVRAAGLAEGYKGDQALNDQKFLMNWFVDNEKWVEADKKNDKNEPWRKYYLGPRDRLYRTGDLGKYLETGDVECTGRADDQVKIRGFRIELNDIDNNLRQHPLIRDCKTLVRRDRDEEPTLASYIVPELKQWPQWLKDRGIEDIEDEGTDIGPVVIYTKRFRRMQTEVRDHLKDRLPGYAVPTIFIVLNKLPLNPNGKVDKQKLPFPDIAEQSVPASSEDLRRWESMSETERAVATKWANLIRGVNAKTITLQNDFFDLGGHSILAQQMLLTVRKEMGANISINTLYEYPSLGGFSAQVDKQLNIKNSMVKAGAAAEEEKDSIYSKSLEDLLKQLPATYQTADPDAIRKSPQPTVFLTGATGFLGTYIIKDILERTSRIIKLIVHVRSVKDSQAALDRLRRSLQGYGLWQAEWAGRLSFVVGDLSKPQLGIDQQNWQALAKEVDLVIHNGAAVHWVRPYNDLVASNVLSTLDAMRLCNEGKPKMFTFVSSTSVLDTDHYVKLSDQHLSTGRDAISEDDDMEGSRTGLGTGYGQTKWVSEQLVRAAGKRGLLGSVVRPGYILGDVETGACNTDDFLIRMLKGCIQLSSRPRIINTVNSVPVKHVARVVVAAALNPIPGGVHVVHVTGHPRLRMNEYLSLLEYYGYKVPEVDYDIWKDELEKYISAGGVEKDHEQHALMPLYHFCVNDLPATTRAPELDDRNAVKILKADAENWTDVDESAGYGITREDVGRYLSYLAEIGFVSWPSSKGRPLPKVNVSPTQLEALGAVGGRGGIPK